MNLGIHGIALAFLVGFATFFGLLVSSAYGPVAGSIAGGLLGASMVMRYIERAIDRAEKGDVV